jgi:hypothetical protein
MPEATEKLYYEIDAARVDAEQLKFLRQHKATIRTNPEGTALLVKVSEALPKGPGRRRTTRSAWDEKHALRPAPDPKPATRVRDLLTRTPWTVDETSERQGQLRWTWLTPRNQALAVTLLDGGESLRMSAPFTFDERTSSLQLRLLRLPAEPLEVSLCLLSARRTVLWRSTEHLEARGAATLSWSVAEVQGNVRARTRQIALVFATDLDRVRFYIDELRVG